MAQSSRPIGSHRFRSALRNLAQLVHPPSPRYPTAARERRERQNWVTLILRSASGQAETQSGFLGVTSEARTVSKKVESPRERCSHRRHR